MKELLIATNPDPDSTLAYLMRVPLGEGIVLRTAGNLAPHQSSLLLPGPGRRVAGRSRHRGADPAALMRASRSRHRHRRHPSRENRSQLVFTTARGGDAVFWQSPRTRKQARPQVSLPTARAAGITELEIVVDAHERYAYRFAGQQVRTTSRGLPCGDYGIILDGTLVAAVERKSCPT